jgi:hypothetical protein
MQFSLKQIDYKSWCSCTVGFTERGLTSDDDEIGLLRMGNHHLKWVTEGNEVFGHLHIQQCMPHTIFIYICPYRVSTSGEVIVHGKKWGKKWKLDKKSVSVCKSLKNNMGDFCFYINYTLLYLQFTFFFTLLSVQS